MSIWAACIHLKLCVASLLQVSKKIEDRAGAGWMYAYAHLHVGNANQNSLHDVHEDDDDDDHLQCFTEFLKLLLYRALLQFIVCFRLGRWCILTTLVYYYWMDVGLVWMWFESWFWVAFIVVLLRVCCWLLAFVSPLAPRVNFFVCSKWCVDMDMNDGSWSL